VLPGSLKVLSGKLRVLLRRPIGTFALFEPTSAEVVGATAEFEGTYWKVAGAYWKTDRFLCAV
jgi:hypothetical protein